MDGLRIEDWDIDVNLMRDQTSLYDFKKLHISSSTFQFVEWNGKSISRQPLLSFKAIQTTFWLRNFPFKLLTN